MNRFLSKDTNTNAVEQTVTTIDSTAVTDALLARIQVLEDVSYDAAQSAYSEIANRKLASDGIVYPAWALIATSTHVLGRNGSMVPIENHVLADCWQIIPYGGRNIGIVSSTGNNLQTSQGISTTLEIISSDGGSSYHICTQTGYDVWTGEFITPSDDGSNLLLLSNFTSAADLRAANRWSISYVDFTNVFALEFPTQPTVDTSLTLSDFTVRMVDNLGNLTPGIPGSLSLSVESGPGTVSSTQFSFTGVTGIATLQNVNLSTPGTYRLRATYNLPLFQTGVYGITQDILTPFFFAPGITYSSDGTNPYIEVRIVFTEKTPDRFVSLAIQADSHNPGEIIANVHKDSSWGQPADGRYDHFDWRITYVSGSGYKIYNIDQTTHLSQQLTTSDSNFTRTAVDTNSLFFDIERVVVSGEDFYRIKTKESSMSSTPYLTWQNPWSYADASGQDSFESVDPVWFEALLTGANANEQYVKFATTASPYGLYE